ncbi:hypothetical protein MCHI_003569 [Candidatus Magnetoovum chiemensis]|nr:hypothetical protein MCHI_003569 [Candidatus Magnetoovum chiemensis]
MLVITGCGSEDSDSQTSINSRAYVGSIENSSAFIGIVSDGTNVMACFCDGDSILTWFKGSETPITGSEGSSVLDITTDFGRLTAELDGSSAKGAVEVSDGAVLPFVSALVTDDQSGLFRLDVQYDDQKIVGGWIALPDG